MEIPSGKSGYLLQRKRSVPVEREKEEEEIQ